MLSLHTVHNTASSIAYTDPVWCTCTTALRKRLEWLQNFAPQVILRCCWETSTTSMWQELRWPTLTSKRKLSESLYLCLRQQSTAPLHLTEAHFRCHYARSVFANCLTIPQTPSKFECISFSFRGPPRWNTLTPTL